MERNGHPEAFWREHVEAWLTGGGSQRAYSTEHGLAASSFSYWCRRLAKAGSAQTPIQPLSLVPAKLVAEAAPSELRLQVHSPAGWRLEFSALPPAAWLATLLGRPA